MQILYLLEKMRFPVLNEIMLLVTSLGEETAFLVAAILVFWCVDKHKGYFVLTVGFLGTMLNQIMKLTFGVPRPWVLDPEFTIVEQAREAATGFSFPSGHSTISVGTFGSIALCSEKKWMRWTCLAICVLVPFSRMYLGVHTPKDVLVGAATSVILIWCLRRMATEIPEKSMKQLLSFELVLAVIMLAYATWFPFEIAESELHNLESGIKNGYTMLGCIAGFMISYPLERKYVKFDTKAVWWAQILKAVLGLALVLAVKEGLRGPLDMIFGGHMIARAVRYALVVLTAGALWPATFRWFGKLGVKK